jgi:hypothetical protein
MTPQEVENAKSEISQLVRAIQRAHGILENPETALANYTLSAEEIRAVQSALLAQLGEIKDAVRAIANQVLFGNIVVQPWTPRRIDTSTGRVRVVGPITSPPSSGIGPFRISKDVFAVFLRHGEDEAREVLIPRSVDYEYGEINIELDLSAEEYEESGSSSGIGGFNIEGIMFQTDEDTGSNLDLGGEMGDLTP